MLFYDEFLIFILQVGRESANLIRGRTRCGGRGRIGKDVPKSTYLYVTSVFPSNRLLSFIESPAVDTAEVWPQQSHLPLPIVEFRSLSRHLR